MVKKRIAKVRQKLQEAGGELLLVQDPINLRYLTGLNVSAGRLWLSSEGAATLMLDARYYERGKELQKDGQEGTWELLLLEKDTQAQFLKAQKVKNLLIDGRRLCVSEYQSLQKQFSGEVIAAEGLVDAVRAVKDEDELQKLREAALLGSKGYDFLYGLVDEGVSEKVLARKLEQFWLESGGEGLAFEPIVAFGEHSAIPHHEPQGRQLKKNEAVLFDIGVSLGGYHSDMTRSFFYGDQPDERFHEIWQVVNEAHEKALSLCRPGVKVGELDRAARGYIESCGFGKEFSHSLGHGIGLEVHEYPRLRDEGLDKEVVLEAGMVFTLEPGVYLPGFAGVRLEDTVLITNEGVENLTLREKRERYS